MKNKQSATMTEFLTNCKQVKQGNLGKVALIEKFINSVVTDKNTLTALTESDLVTINNQLLLLQNTEELDAITRTSIRKIKANYDRFLVYKINYFQLVD